MNAPPWNVCGWLRRRPEVWYNAAMRVKAHEQNSTICPARGSRFNPGVFHPADGAIPSGGKVLRKRGKTSGKGATASPAAPDGKAAKNRKRRSTGDAARPCVASGPEDCGSAAGAVSRRSGVVKDRKALAAKYGRGAAECFAKMYSEELRREREAHAQTAEEAAADIARLAQEVATAQMWRRYERRKRIALGGVGERLLTMDEAWQELDRRRGYHISRRTFYNYVNDGEYGIVRVKRKGMQVRYKFTRRET